MIDNTSDPLSPAKGSAHQVVFEEVSTRCQISKLRIQNVGMSHFLTGFQINDLQDIFLPGDIPDDR